MFVVVDSDNGTVVLHMLDVLTASGISPFLKLPVKPIGTSRQFITPETYKVSLLRNTLVTIRERITGCELK